MRIYKQTYSKPLPEGVKIISRKNGKFASFKNSKGHTTEARLTKSGDKILLETAHWHVEFEDNQGIRRRLKAYTNERASYRLADKIDELLSCQANNRQPDEELSKWLERLPSTIRDELVKLGLLDTERMAAGKSLKEHLEDFYEVVATGNTSRHAKLTCSRIRRVFDGCGFVYWTDISASKVQKYLNQLKDISKQTYNCYVQAVKQFDCWMVANNLASQSRLELLKRVRVLKCDRKIRRRAATPDELRRLLEATAAAPERLGVSGYERALIYRFAAESGLRASAIGSLTVSSFDLEGGYVTVKDSDPGNKNYEEHTYHILPRTAIELKEVFRHKTPTAKAFNIPSISYTAKMIRKDLEDAGIPYKNDAGEQLDFHALRHTFGTSIKREPSATKMALGGWKTAAMADRYSHPTLLSDKAALERSIPDYTLPSNQSQEQQKTGTDGKDVGGGGEILSKSCFQGAPMRTDTDNSGKKTADTIQKTTLCVNNEGAQSIEHTFPNKRIG